MSNIQTVKAQIQSLIDLANTTTSRQDTNLTDGVNALVEGFGKGGSSGSIENGFVVNFFNAENELIESDMVKCGYYVDAPPNIDVDGWKDDNGIIFEDFPFTKSEEGVVVNLYSYLSEGYDNLLYEAFAIDKTSYPYVYLAFQCSNDKVGSFYHMAFLSSCSVASGTNNDKLVRTGKVSTDKTATFTKEIVINSASAVDFFISNKSKVTFYDASNQTSNSLKGYIIHSNFDISALNNNSNNTCEVKYRLD